MLDEEPATRTCPLCKEDVKPDAVRCKHCQGMIRRAEPAHEGVCPYCKETIKPGAIRCVHCKANLVPSGITGDLQTSSLRSYFEPQRKRLLRPAGGIPRHVTRDYPPCPPAIIDVDPEGHGLGVWVLVGESAETCDYRYAGGIV